MFDINELNLSDEDKEKLINAVQEIDYIIDNNLEDDNQVDNYLSSSIQKGIWELGYQLKQWG